MADLTILAKLILPSTVSNTGDQFVLHPSLMDAALQASLGLIINTGEPVSPPLPFALEELLASGKFALIVYGHTHEKTTRVQNGTILLNPGECCGWVNGESTIAVVNLQSREIEEFKL